MKGPSLIFGEEAGKEGRGGDSQAVAAHEDEPVAVSEPSASSVAPRSLLCPVPVPSRPGLAARAPLSGRTQASGLLGRSTARRRWTRREFHSLNESLWRPALVALGKYRTEFIENEPIHSFSGGASRTPFTAFLFWAVRFAGRHAGITYKNTRAWFSCDQVGERNHFF